MSLPTNDPTLAVVVDRLQRLSDDFEKDRHERKAEMRALEDSFHVKLDEVYAEQKKVGTILNKAKGGYLVLLGLGGLVAWIAGLFEKLFKW